MIVRRPATRPLLLLLVGALGALSYGFQSSEQALLAEMNDAIEQVKRIVNQPVTALPRTPDAAVSVSSPGWFHEGAARPDFLSVDVRATQQFPYKHEYVTSDITPGLMFRGSDLEFNPMTKYFYTDRSRPKKRLGPDEMDEINRLYRIIGARQQELARRRAEPAPGANPADPTAPGRPTALYLALAALVVMLAFVAYRRRGARP